MTHVVYVLRETPLDNPTRVCGPVKVGHATAGDGVEERRRRLQTGNPRILVVHYVFAAAPLTQKEAAAAECLVQRWLASSYLEGEWFNVTPDHAMHAVDRAVEHMRNPQFTFFRATPPHPIPDAPMHRSRAAHRAHATNAKKSGGGGMSEDPSGR